jgi:hypothetical protein
MGLILTVIAGIGTAVLLWKPIFGNMDNFEYCLTCMFSNTLWNFLKPGESRRDRQGEIKVTVWLFASILPASLVFHAFK